MNKQVLSPLFQFYLSSIKSMMRMQWWDDEPCFNSTLVQLKALRFRQQRVGREVSILP